VRPSDSRRPYRFRARFWRVARRYPHDFRVRIVAVTAVAVCALALVGCRSTEGNQAGASGGITTSASPSPTGTGEQPSPSASEAGGSPTATALPDVCAMLSRTEVSALVGGKPILSVDPDPGPNSPVRYCQWQMSGARLEVQLSSTTPTRFRQDHLNEPAIGGLGDDAFFYSNHLFVRKGSVQIDVYASTAEGTTNDQMVAKALAAIVVARLKQ
jgi:hypothetical protein